ncbi:amidohydrolase [Enteractinococcus helveticum]|uniref:Amidohydrolase 3 domain-containing protein n=1 Tax=Enteractinococcus helveticum TaxID=1837282 RepID=A0A1B7M226_9MICC|nr:amidohydrolase [Enteractinococcus helveticum]OAV62610.1 hypothetical protein A6F49_05450 [Enteractinococcus helveticum]
MSDLIITNAQIWAPELIESDSILIRNDRIVVVGNLSEIHDRNPHRPIYLDVHGSAVLPGFHDAHVHPLGGGLDKLGCDLTTEHSLEGYERLILEFADAHESEWITGGGWFGDVFPGGFPHREFIDRILPDRPVVLTSHDAHGVWVNSEALKRAGIGQETPDPTFGIIQRDENGEATGVLLEAASELVTGHLPKPSPDRLVQAMAAAQEYLFSLGITAWHDAILGEYLTMPSAIETYQQMLSDGTLSARVSGSMWWIPGNGPEDVCEILQRVSEAKVGGFEVTSVKIMQDGMCENCTAAMLAPYDNVHPEISGDSVIPPEDLSRIVTALDAHGLSVHFHGVGDRAVRECLNAVEAARIANGPEGPKHQIAHLDVVNPEDFSRFAELNVTANLQPLWARADQEILERKLPLIGERAKHHFPFGSLQRAGAHIAFGSDWPVSDPNPIWGLHTACTRTAPLDDPHALNEESRVAMTPEECLGLEVAVRAYTLGPAEINNVDHEMGRIQESYLADLVILSGPLNEVADLNTLSVAKTLVGGVLVYEASSSSIGKARV